MHRQTEYLMDVSFIYIFLDDFDAAFTLSVIVGWIDYQFTTVLSRSSSNN